MWNIEKTVRVNPHAAAADSHSNKEKKQICWFWKRNCHDRPDSMSLTFRRPLYNVLVFLGSNDWRLFQPSQLSPPIWVPVFRPWEIPDFYGPPAWSKRICYDTPPLLNLSICNVSVWTSATCQMLKWGHVNSLLVTWKSSRPAQGVDPRSAPHESCAVGVPRPAPRSSVLPVALGHPATAVQPETARATVEQKHANVHLEKSHHSKLDAWCMFFWFDLGGQILNIEMRQINSTCQWEEDLAPKTLRILWSSINGLKWLTTTSIKTYIYNYIYICAQRLGFAQALQRRGFPFTNKWCCKLPYFLWENNKGTRDY